MAQGWELTSLNNGEDNRTMSCPIHLYTTRIEIHWHCNAMPVQGTQTFDIQFCENFTGWEHRLLLSAQVG